jgi:phosphoglycolate phosphatase
LRYTNELADLAVTMNVADQQRKWDEYDAYIFDVDDTLIHCDDAVHYFAFCTGLTALAGRSVALDGVKVHGSTDTAIMRDALTLAGIPESTWKSQIGECCNCMGKYVAEHSVDFNIRVLPGAVKAIEYLLSRGAVVGLGTGNLETIARAKLHQCGLLDYFQFGGFSDHDTVERPRVIEKALRDARTLVGPHAAICVIGDTPADILAARANDLDAMAVASGPYSLEQLQTFQPRWCFRSLEVLPFSSF